MSNFGVVHSERCRHVDHLLLEAGRKVAEGGDELITRTIGKKVKEPWLLALAVKTNGCGGCGSREMKVDNMSVGEQTDKMDVDEQVDHMGVVQQVNNMKSGNQVTVNQADKQIYTTKSGRHANSVKLVQQVAYMRGGKKTTLNQIDKQINHMGIYKSVNNIKGGKQVNDMKLRSQTENMKPDKQVGSLREDQQAIHDQIAKQMADEGTLGQVNRTKVGEQINHNQIAQRTDYMGVFQVDTQTRDKSALEQVNTQVNHMGVFNLLNNMRADSPAIEYHEHRRIQNRAPLSPGYKKYLATLSYTVLGPHGVVYISAAIPMPGTQNISSHRMGFDITTVSYATNRYEPECHNCPMLGISLSEIESLIYNDGLLDQMKAPWDKLQAEKARGKIDPEWARVEMRIARLLRKRVRTHRRITRALTETANKAVAEGKGFAEGKGKGRAF